jgi:hypothetical protein
VGIEATISQGVRAFGMRCSRYIDRLSKRVHTALWVYCVENILREMGQMTLWLSSYYSVYYEEGLLIPAAGKL